MRTPHSIEPRTSTTRVAVKIEETLATERCNIPIVTFCTLSKCVGRTHKPTFSHEPSKEGLSISRLLVSCESGGGLLKLKSHISFKAAASDSMQVYDDMMTLDMNFFFLRFLLTRKYIHKCQMR